jgi:hypothetical protein
VGLALAALRPNEWVDFKLQETYDVNHNTKLFRFSFDPEKNLGLNVASCLLTMLATKPLLHCWLKTIINCFSIVPLYRDGLAVMLLSSDFLQIDSQVFQDSKCMRYL